MDKLDQHEFVARGGLIPLDGRKDDIYLTSSSFEPRSRALIDSLGSNYRCGKAIVYSNIEDANDPAPNAALSCKLDMINTLGRFADKVSEAEGSWIDSVQQISSLRQALLGNASDKFRARNVTIDISGFTREALIVAISMIRVNFDYPRIRVLYVSPESYGNWLSKGFRLIRNVMGFAGIQQPSRSTILVILSGFELTRTTRIIEEHEPSKVLLGIANPPTHPDFLDRNNAEQKVTLARQDVERFNFPSHDIDQCVRTLEDLLHPYLLKNNIVVAPMSSKPSTVAAALLAEKHPEIQITYCVPGEYNASHYSTGVLSIYSQIIT